MIQVFGTPPSRALRVVWMLEELGLPYEVQPLDFMNRRDNAEFMAINPAGYVPAIRDGEVTMYESPAIVEYLGAKYGGSPLVPKLGDANYPAYLQFLHFGEGSLASLLNIVFGSRFFGPEEERDNYGARMAIDMVVGRSCSIAEVLKTRPYLAGDEFTGADISVAYPLGLGDMLGFSDRLEPIVRDYLARLQERPAYQRAAAQAKGMA